MTVKLWDPPKSASRSKLRDFMADTTDFFDNRSQQEHEQHRRVFVQQGDFQLLVFDLKGLHMDFTTRGGLHISEGSTRYLHRSGYRELILKFAAFAPKILVCLPHQRLQPFRELKLCQKALNPPLYWARVELNTAMADLQEVIDFLPSAPTTTPEIPSAQVLERWVASVAELESLQAETSSTRQAKRRRGRPTTIPDELKRKALAAKCEGKSNKELAKILYTNTYPSPQQVKNVPSILRHFRKTHPGEG